jgi:tungstate transport system ATP-binding protein
MYTLNNIKLSKGSFTMDIPQCHLAKGEVYSIAGPNGCGKSTMLDLLAMLNEPDEGSIELNGTVVSFANMDSLIAKRRQVGYLPQNPYLFNMSVRSNIGYGLKVRGCSRELIKEKTEVMLSDLFLTDVADRPAHSLSGGEAQRVALARTLILDADVYLLDEPTANVDQHNVPVVEQYIKNVNKGNNATIILTTHSEEQACRLSDHLISIADGRITNITPRNPKENE